MKDYKWHEILRKYLYQYRFTILVFFIFAAIFAGIFALYNLNTEAVLYAAAICIILAIVILSVHFIYYCKRHKERYRILHNILLLTDNLPVPVTLAESDYQKMIVSLKQINTANITKWDNERKESIDYYTTWVHQIKTPISVMRMILQSEDTDEHLQLSAELFRIEQYVEMVLCYFRLDSNSSDFIFKQYNLDNIIKQAVRKYAPQFIRKRIKLIYKPVSISVLTDEKWLLFILEQLLSNAIKYTEKGSVTISVTPDEVLHISDTGIGIAAEDIPRIFEKGFTGYNGRADKKSTGLGLYLSKQAAEKLSHKLSVKSSVGIGTEFLIDLHSDKLETE